MIQLYISILITFLAINSAFAGIILDMRFDHKSYDPNEYVSGSPKEYSQFQVSRLRIDMNGQINPETIYRARFNMLQNSATNTQRDGTSKFIDFAYLTRKLDDNFSFTLGKIITGMGGVEGSSSPADIYLTSIANNEVSSIYYPVGVQMNGSFDGHAVKLSIANTTEDETDGTTTNNVTNTRNLVGVIYTSQILDGMFMPNISYHTEKYGNSPEKVNTYLAVGTKIVFSDFEVEADFLKNSYKQDPESATYNKDTQSVLALIRYKVSELGSVHVKYEDSKKTGFTSASTSDSITKITGITGAIEYRPVADENWRLHFAYTQKTTRLDGATNDGEEKVFLVGTRLLADLMN